MKIVNSDRTNGKTVKASSLSLGTLFRLDKHGSLLMVGCMAVNMPQPLKDDPPGINRIVVVNLSHGGYISMIPGDLDVLLEHTYEGTLTLE